MKHCTGGYFGAGVGGRGRACCFGKGLGGRVLVVRRIKTARWIRLGRVAGGGGVDLTGAGDGLAMRTGKECRGKAR